MWESGVGRHTVFPWSDARPAEPCPYAVGDAVYSGDHRGAVVSVDTAAGTMGIAWSDGDGGAITYPMDATYLRKAMPWES